MANFRQVLDIEIEDTELIAYVVRTFCPEEVFEKDELIKWAEENGFVEGDK